MDHPDEDTNQLDEQEWIFSKPRKFHCPGSDTYLCLELFLQESNSQAEAQLTSKIARSHRFLMCITSTFWSPESNFWKSAVKKSSPNGDAPSAHLWGCPFVYVGRSSPLRPDSSREVRREGRWHVRNRLAGHRMTNRPGCSGRC